jgi:small subunit ribosomal protein S16
MLKIKLARFGKRHQPHFRFVITEARDKRDGRYVANIGHYAPTQQPKLIKLDLKEYDEWVKKGAQPTETVSALAERLRSGKPFTKNKKPSKKALAKAQKPAEEVVETKVEEAPAEATE